MHTGSHSHEFAAISMKDGSKIWNTILPDRIESSACLSPNGAFVIVGCYDGVVYIFRSDSGKVRICSYCNCNILTKCCELLMKHK